MDNGGGTPSTNDQSRKETSISLAASSMINAEDMITAEAYQANLRRIQEVKEMVRRLESNNEAAHRNYLVDQLEKRAKDGRDAENMLTQLRDQPGLQTAVQFTNNAPSDRSEDVLPTTATLVEVPDPHSSPSHNSSAPRVNPRPPRTVQQTTPVSYQWSVPQVQPYYPGAFQYHMPPTTTHPSLQRDAGLYTQTPVNPRHWYTTQNPPARPWVHYPSAQTGSQPIQTQQPVRSWVSYAPQIPPVAGVASGYYASSGEWGNRASAHTPASSDSSNSTYHVATQSITSQPQATTHNQPMNSTSEVPVPLRNVPALPVKHLVQPPVGSLKPSGSQSQSVTTTVPNPVAISEPQRSRRPSGQERQQQQPQRPSVPQLYPQELQPQRPPQLPLQPQRLQQSQQSLQHPLSHQQPPPPSANRAHSTTVPQPHIQSPQVRGPLPTEPPILRTQPQPTIVQEKVWQQDARMHQMDQATFIKQFHNAVRHGTLQLKAFWFQAKASGIDDEWFKIAINSLPRNVWNAVVAQANQPTINTTSRTDATHQPLPMIPNSNVSTISVVPPLSTAPIQTTSSTQQGVESSISSERDITHSAPTPYSKSYATQRQYYAEHTTKSYLPQMAGNPASPPRNIAPTQITVTTPQRDVPQATANARTPNDANKSTLARDVLRALGKIVQKPQGMGGELMDKVNNREGDKMAEVNSSQLVPPTPETSTALPEVGPVDSNPPSIPSENPNGQDVPQGDTPPCRSTVQSVEAVRSTIDEGPIMIDLTLEDSDESIDGKGQEPNFLMQTSTSAVISPQSASPINTTNHTPLLKSHSLEEPACSVIGSDNAGVRMRSPPLRLVADENEESQLLYPALETAEPVWQSSERFPSERTADEGDQLDGQLPLFLPSPPVSPAPTEPPTTDVEMVNDEDEGELPLKRRTVDVDKMEIDSETVALPRVNKRRRQQVYVLIPPAPPYVKKAKMKERVMAESIELDSEGGQDEEFQYTHLEQLLIEESKLRLSERRCRWSDCAAILNCAANLLVHLRNHAREETSETPFFCRWATCQKQFDTEHERDVHLERHTVKPLPCSFAGCDEQFDKPVEVMQHEVQHKTDRGESLMRKPTCQPIIPAIPARLGPPPHRLPSHRVIPRRIAKCQISNDRHGIVGPWVLWNIFSPVDLNMRKQNASMRGRPIRQVNSYEVDSSDPRRDDYDFLLAISPHSAKAIQLDDLDSSAITMSAARGLTLWGSGPSASGEEPIAAEAGMPSPETDEEWDKVPRKSTTQEGRQSHEEDSVERMLAI